MEITTGDFLVGSPLDLGSHAKNVIWVMDVGSSYCRQSKENIKYNIQTKKQQQT